MYVPKMFKLSKVLVLLRVTTLLDCFQYTLYVMCIKL